MWHLVGVLTPSWEPVIEAVITISTELSCRFQKTDLSVKKVQRAADSGVDCEWDWKY